MLAYSLLESLSITFLMGLEGFGKKTSKDGPNVLMAKYVLNFAM
jgi:hypothetical protein